MLKFSPQTAENTLNQVANRPKTIVINAATMSGIGHLNVGFVCVILKKYLVRSSFQFTVNNADQ